MKCDKPILDCTCGSRVMWFDKKNENAVFTDKRRVYDEQIWKSTKNDSVRTLNVDPDVICDFTDMPFEDNTFYLVVFDPPHLTNVGETAWIGKKYGKLPTNWKPMIHDGFNECMRVLKPYGTLVFKWAEIDIPLKEILDCIDAKPLFGHRAGRKMQTHWMTFMKLPEDGNPKQETLF